MIIIRSLYRCSIYTTQQGTDAYTYTLNASSFFKLGDAVGISFSWDVIKNAIAIKKFAKLTSYVKSTLVKIS